MNTLNSGRLEDLQPNQVLLLTARKVSNGKIQLEFAEKIQSKDRPMNALSLLNASDSRFSSGARRAWVTAEPADASERLGINFGDDGEWYDTEKGEMMDLMILNPGVDLNGNKVYFRVLITETTEATEWQLDNIERAAKRAGKEGDFITANGQYIFSNTSAVLAPQGVEIAHTFIESDNQRIAVSSNQGVEADELDF